MKPIFQFHRSWAHLSRLWKLSVKAGHVNQMFPQEQPFETPLVDSLDDPPKKLGEGRHNLLYALVVWVVQDGVIEVTHQVKQTLLLGAWHRVVGSVEIGDQNTLEPI